MQSEHARFAGVRMELQGHANSVGFSMSQPYISLSSNALRRGAEPSAGVSCGVYAG